MYTADYCPEDFANEGMLLCDLEEGSLIPPKGTKGHSWGAGGRGWTGKEGWGTPWKDDERGISYREPGSRNQDGKRTVFLEKAEPPRAHHVDGTETEEGRTEPPPGAVRSTPSSVRPGRLSTAGPAQHHTVSACPLSGRGDRNGSVREMRGQGLGLCGP